MAITFSIRGTTHPWMPLKRAMHIIAREALAAGIAPLKLQLHNGTSHAGDRWLGKRGYPTREAAVRAAQASNYPKRWFGKPGEVLEFAGEYWVLHREWSRNTSGGSSLADLEQLQRRYPQLQLSWQHSDDAAGDETVATGQPVLVCNVGWMTAYRGVTAGDKLTGGGSYNDRAIGHEAYNFLPEGGVYRGYVRPQGNGINISELGGPREAESLHGVTVFWVAKDPKRPGTRVVGWYKDATVFAERQQPPKDTQRRLPDGSIANYLVESNRARLLPVDARLHGVARMRPGMMGRANVWYPDAAHAADLLGYMRRVEAGEPAAGPERPRHPPRLLDVEERQRIEKAAIEAVWSWYDALGFELKSVEHDNVGWDLEATRDGELVRIEVKGTSRPLADAVVELTPNEYSKMKDATLRASWRLAIVIVGKDDSTDVHVFSWDETGRWVSATAGELRVEVVDSARCRVGP